MRFVYPLHRCWYREPILAAEVKRSVEKPDSGGDTGLRRKGPSGFFLLLTLEREAAINRQTRRKSRTQNSNFCEQVYRMSGRNTRQ